MFTKDTGNFRVTKHYDYSHGKEDIYYVPEKEIKAFFSTKWIPISKEQFCFDSLIDFPYLCVDMESALKIIKLYKENKLDGSYSEIVYSEVNGE